MKIVSIHQPETFPYAGYFNKMLYAHEFIILDNVQFKKNNYQNRNRIIHVGKPKWLTFPVDMTHRLESTIRDTRLADTVDWKSRNIKVLEDAYKGSPYFKYHMPVLREIIEKSDDSLLHLNMAIIDYIRYCLDINTPLVYASEIDVSSHKSDLVFDLCKSVEANVYLSGQGGRDYLDKSRFEEADIEVLYQSFDDSRTYQQQTHEFTPYMSVIDILMNNTEEDARLYVERAFTYST